MPDFLSGGIIFSVGIVWLLHKFFLLHIIFTDAFDYDMCKDILAVVMPVRVGVDKRLVPWKIFCDIFQLQ